MNSHRFTDAADVTEPAAADADADADAEAAEDAAGAGAGAGTVDEEEGAEEEEEEGAGAALAEEPGRGGECMRATARGDEEVQADRPKSPPPSPLTPTRTLSPADPLGHKKDCTETGARSQDHLADERVAERLVGPGVAGLAPKADARQADLGDRAHL